MTATRSPIFSGYINGRVVIVFACQDKDQPPKIQ